MTGIEASAKSIAKFFVAVYLPLLWLYYAPSVLRFASLSDFVRLLALSIAMSWILALLFGWAFVGYIRLVRPVLPESVRGKLPIMAFVAFLSVLVAVDVIGWLATHGLPLRRTILVPVITLASLTITAWFPSLPRSALSAVTENAWSLLRFPIYITLIGGAALTAVTFGARAATLLAADPSPKAPGAASSTPSPAGITLHPSIVLISLDAFSASRSDLYGASVSTTPSISRFARDAATFDMEIAAANFTASAVATMQTGQYPWTHRILGHEGYFRSQPTTLASALHRSGYRTAVFNANWFADPRHTNSARGWDVMVGPYDATPMPRARLLCATPLCDTARLASMPPLAEISAVYEYVVRKLGGLERVRYPPDAVLTDARKWILENRNSSPLLVWIHLFPPHNPYLSPPPFLHSILPKKELDTAEELMTIPLHQFAHMGVSRTRELEERYQESLRYVDDRVGRFLVDPSLADFLARSIVVITSDHGESFERNFVGHTGPLLTQSLVHVPLIIRTPTMRGPRRISTAVSETDIMPTILDLAGVPVPRSVDGISLKPLLEGIPSSPRTIYSMNFERASVRGPLLHQRHSVALVEWPWKYVEYEGVPGMSAELYDLAFDPSERVNLARVRPKLIRHYSALINHTIAQTDAKRE